MKRHSKKYISLLLAIIVALNFPLFANTTLTTSQKTELNTYVSDLELCQKHIYSVAQSIVFSDAPDITSVQNTLTMIEKNITKISAEITSSLSSASHDTVFYRDLLLIGNSVGYIKASLYELNLIMTQSSSSEKLATLQRFFNFRVYANNSIRFFDSLQPSS